MHLSNLIVLSTVLAVSMAGPMASSSDCASASSGDKTNCLFQCPEAYGTCNTCTYLPDGTIASVTRKVCGDYDQETCLRLYGQGFICEDNCNRCTCAESGLISTMMACPPYNYENCVDHYGNKSWQYGDRMYVCSKHGIVLHYTN
ncbi:hypothetical protein BGW42_008121 [Actinomortierella wolfii]|nr:hypothetical protein BGW42_008121 [Actinomortierella wolfii]